MFSCRKKVLAMLISLFMIGTIFIVAAEDKSNDNSPLPFMIKVVNAKTGRGIPCVELRTNNDVTYYTDSAGVVAYYEPDMMNEDIYFHISSDGYVFPEDKSGNRGQKITIKPGGSITLEMEQTNIAERLYRITGEGIYRHSYMLGLPIPVEKPLLNARVSGSDSVHTAIYNDRLYWFWGDTHGPFHVLGNFRATAATSLLPKDGGLDPSVGVNLEYFTDPNSGFVKKMIPPLPDGNGVSWLHVLEPKEGEPLIAGYATLKPARGLVIFNDETNEFELLKEFTGFKDGDWQIPYGGKSTRYEENGVDYWLFPRPWPHVRVRANIDAVQDQEQYEAFTPLKPGTKYDKENTQLERDENGNLVWGWKRNTEPLDQLKEEELLKLGLLSEADNLYYQFKDVDTGKRVQLHGSSLKWNEYRQKWVMIGLEIGGTSFLGEIWYAEADSPQGPWTYAKKIVSHDKYSFYNPLQHEYFFEDDGRIIYFEGTYTNYLTSELKTPHYNYNQIMYKLDLNDIELPLEPKFPIETEEPTDPDETPTVPDETPDPGETPGNSDDETPSGKGDKKDPTKDGDGAPKTGDSLVESVIKLVILAGLLLLISRLIRLQVRRKSHGI